MFNYIYMYVKIPNKTHKKNCQKMLENLCFVFSATTTTNTRKTCIDFLEQK